MKNISKLLQLLCVIFFFVPDAFAQKVGSTSMQFLHVMPCARATALGDAYSVWASGAEAVFWNPSGLALIENQELSSTYIDWIFDAKQGALSYATPLGDLGAVGVQVQYVDFGTFEETSADAAYQVPPNWGFTGRTFHPFSYLVGVTYARSLTDKFAVGIGVKYAHESLFDGQMANALTQLGTYEDVKTWADALLFDFGIRYNTGFRSVQVAASVQNFGADAKYAKESSPVPLLFRFGIAADLIGATALLLSDESDNRLGIAFDLFQPNDYAQQAHLGMEYEFASTVALRAGYKFNYDYEGLTLGGGINHTLGSVKLSFDYSYGSIGTYLGSVQRISLGAGIQ
jgi:hypothetical protein